MTTKTCTKCKKELELSYFYRHPSGAHGRSPDCILCKKAYRREYYQRPEVKARVKERNIEYGIKNKERYRAYRVAYVKANPRIAKAHVLVNIMCYFGLLTRPSKCEYCGIEARIDAHHYDGYADPLKIHWICRSCHKFAHNNPQLKHNVA